MPFDIMLTVVFTAIIQSVFGAGVVSTSTSSTTRAACKQTNGQLSIPFVVYSTTCGGARRTLS